jgi:hypothetical protein
MKMYLQISKAAYTVETIDNYEVMIYNTKALHRLKAEFNPFRAHLKTLHNNKFTC